MNPLVFNSLFELENFLLSASLEEFNQTLPRFSLVYLAESFQILEEARKGKHKAKLEDLFLFIDSPTSLQNIAAHLDRSSFTSFLRFFESHPIYVNRLSFILAGLPSNVFCQLIGNLELNLVEVIKHESALEPLQYQLKMFYAYGEELRKKILTQIDQLIYEFNAFSHQPLTMDLFNDYLRKIEGMNQECQNHLSKLNQALSIAWHTLRADLIEELSQQKERFIQFFTSILGVPEDGLLMHSIILKSFQDAYSHVFESFQHHDETPSLEGLVCLSLWHIEDYIDVGLLPFFETYYDYEEYLKNASEEDRKQYQEHLFTYVQNQLNEKGLSTIGDLKTMMIFSKELLESYIKGYASL